MCGAQAHGVEPDARNYECEACGTDQVFGAEELLMEIASQPALLYGFRERARALLNAQEVPWEVPTT